MHFVKNKMIYRVYSSTLDLLFDDLNVTLILAEC